MSSLVTPNRSTRLVLDVAEPIATRPAWSTQRSARQISRARTARNNSVQVGLMPGDGWTLAPLAGDRAQLLTSDYHPAFLAAADVNLAANWAEVLTYRRPDDLTGVGASGSLVSSGAPAFTKRVPAGGSWNTELSADRSAYSQPTLPWEPYPMMRVLSGKTTYPANQGFLVSGLFPAAEDTASLFTFYFGGAVEVRPLGRRAGEFALNMRADGLLTLFERDAAGAWIKRMEHAVPLTRTPQGLYLSLMIFPYGRDSIAFLARSVPFAGEGFTASGLVALVTMATLGGGTSDRFAYRTSPLVAGYVPGLYVTGPGTVRLDVPRDLRPRVQLARLRLPATGTLTDLPWWSPFPLPAATLLTVRANYYAPEDSSIAISMYNAANGAALVSPAPGVFESAGGQSAYYASFAFAADTDREHTPVLWGYEVTVPAAAASLAPATITGGNVRGVRVSGPDLDPTHDTASMQITDPTGALALLRTRGRIPAKINILTSAGALTSTIFEGETATAPATYRGKTGRTWPSTAWHEYALDLVGMWARLEESISLNPQRFHEDTAAPTDPLTGRRPPWKITSIIRELIGNWGGFPAGQLDIPDLPIRLWHGAGRVDEEFMLQPGSSVAQYVLSLARDYLGMILLWDANAGAAGMWRLRYNPSAPYSPIARFREKPVAAGALSTHPNSYAAGETFWEEGTYRSHVRAPECNYVLVVGRGGQLPGGAFTQMAAIIYNPVSFNFPGSTGVANPLSPDYLGRFVPVVLVDSTITTPQACAYMARRIFDQAAHAQQWIQWRAPLLLVTDPADALQTRVRPLRIGDAVYVHKAGAVGTVLIRSCNPVYEHDGLQMAEYEGLLT